jgi:uncharacterized protein YndB with AHSA1/START domain
METKFEITRVFDASRELLFKAWTEQERLKQWWGPKGFVINIINMDVRPEGVFHYNMHTADGYLMWGRFVYREIVVPERIVFVNSFSNNEGTITRAPFSPTWPLEILNILTFTEKEGKTSLTLCGCPQNATKEEEMTYLGNFASMEHGFTGTFDQLAEYLAKY